jgi:3-hydroxyisobutyrate dehydrogenase-like beta-hydroxyacid dehydrogenase
MTNTKPVGLIGLGLVGKALATRLIASGHEVIGFDIHAPACQQAAQIGVTLAPTVGDIGNKADVILLSLPDSETVSRVVADEQLGSHLRQGTLVLDTTTGCPSDAAYFANRFITREVRFIDVTLSGSSEDIVRGEAVALVGAEREDSLSAIVDRFARKAFYLGHAGAGCLSKLVVNHIMGLNRAALAEGLALGEKAGLDLSQLLPILKESAAYSRVMDMKGQRMVESDYEPASRLSQHAKDVGLILKLGEELGAYLPLEQLHQALLEAAIASGYADADNAALIEVFRGGGAEEDKVV